MFTDKSRHYWVKGGAALAVAIPLLLTACSSGGSGSTTTSTTGSGAPKAGTPSGTLTAAMSSGAIDTMDPNQWYYAVTWGLANAMCTTLVRYADQPGTAGTSLVPGTASMPTVSSDGLTYTFTLRPGAKFSDGQAITPADVKYTFMRLMAPAVDTGTGYYFTGLIGAPAYLAGKSTTLAGITTTASTIAFHLSRARRRVPVQGSTADDLPGARRDADEAGHERLAGGEIRQRSVQDAARTRRVGSSCLVFNKNYDQALGARGHVAKIVFAIGVPVDPGGAADPGRPARLPGLEPGRRPTSSSCRRTRRWRTRCTTRPGRR